MLDPSPRPHDNVLSGCAYIGVVLLIGAVALCGGIWFGLLLTGTPVP